MAATPSTRRKAWPTPSLPANRRPSPWTFFFTKGQASVETEISRCRLGDGTSLSMEIYLGGARKSRANKVVRFEDLNDDYFAPLERQRGASIPADLSVRSFAEIESCLDEAGAAKQAERCFNCGICNDCDNCRTYCPEVAVLAARAARGETWAEDAGVDREVNARLLQGLRRMRDGMPALRDGHRGAAIMRESARRQPGRRRSRAAGQSQGRFRLSHHAADAYRRRAGEILLGRKPSTASSYAWKANIPPWLRR